jgi:hypothetical protein
MWLSHSCISCDFFSCGQKCIESLIVVARNRTVTPCGRGKIRNKKYPVPTEGQAEGELTCEAEQILPQPGPTVEQDSASNTDQWAWLHLRPEKLKPPSEYMESRLISRGNKFSTKKFA